MRGGGGPPGTEFSNRSKASWLCVVVAPSPATHVASGDSVQFRANKIMIIQLEASGEFSLPLAHCVFHQRRRLFNVVLFLITVATPVDCRVAMRPVVLGQKVGHGSNCHIPGSRQAEDREQRTCRGPILQGSMLQGRSGRKHVPACFCSQASAFPGTQPLHCADGITAGGYLTRSWSRHARSSNWPSVGRVG